MTKIRLLVAWKWAWGREGEVTAKGHKGTFWGDGNILYLDHNSSYIGVYIYQNSLNTTFKVPFILCQLHPQYIWFKYVKGKVIFRHLEIASLSKDANKCTSGFTTGLTPI